MMSGKDRNYKDNSKKNIKYVGDFMKTSPLIDYASISSSSSISRFSLMASRLRPESR